MAGFDQGYVIDLDTKGDEEEDESIASHSDSDSLVEEKFRVDRKKLEQMLQGAQLSSCSSAETFFDRVMKTTGTHISWPSRLKIGAKSRKDPHIKVAGKPEDVRQAKKMLNILDAKTNRVTLKIDVSHTDHSHAIGKGGRSVKEVSTNTQCHIHFPDSNRTNPMEKSNQVTISGLPEGVEKARRQIRDMLPIIFSFDLPFMGLPNLFDVQRDSFLQQVEKQFDVQVSYKHRPKLMVCVKGVVESAGRTKEAAHLVLKHHYREYAAHVLVSLSIEVDPKHLPFVRPQVEKVTLAASVQFPDSSAPANRKSTLTLTGTIESVFECRQFIVGCLPVFLIFDINLDDSSSLETVDCIEEKFGVNIIVKPRVKQQGKSVVIRTTERNVLALYEARCALLSLDPRRDGNVPSSHLTAAHSNGASMKLPTNTTTAHSLMSAAAAVTATNGQCSNDSLTAAAMAAALAQQQSQQQQIQQSQQQQLQHLQQTQQQLQQSQQQQLQQQQQQLQQTQQQQLQQSNQLYLLAATTTTTSSSSPQLLVMPPSMTPTTSEASSQRAATWMDWSEATLAACQPAAPQQRSCSLASLPAATLTAPLSATTPPVDVPSGQLSAVSTPVQHLSPSSSGGASSTVELPPSTPPMATTTLTVAQSNDGGGAITVGMTVGGADTAGPLETAFLNSLSSSSSSSGIESDADPSTSRPSTIPNDRRAPGAEYSIKQRELRQRVAQTSDYDEKKAVARRKIRQELSSKPRIPNDEWVGQGFSFSLPTEALRHATAAPCPGAATGRSATTVSAALVPSHERSFGAFPEVTTAAVGANLGAGPSGCPIAPMALWSEQNGVVHPADPNVIKNNGLFMQSCVESGFSQLLEKPLMNLPSGFWNSNSSSTLDSTGVDSSSHKSLTLTAADLTDFLCKIGLGKYADILSQHEVDLQTFMTLSDNDLKELGINTFGARRKMLMAIQELQQLLV